LFLAFSIISAFLILPELLGSLTPEWLDKYWQRIPEIDDRIELYGVVLSAAGLGLISLSLWHAVSASDSQERAERHRWVNYLLKEWHSPMMNAARQRWYDEGRGKTNDSNIASSLTAEVFIIVNFFEKYGRLYHASALDKRVTQQIFGDYAAWYRDNFFDEIFSSSVYSERMRAIDRETYIRLFIENVAKSKE
jgi:hypothetical protein